jgi:hypothetical protein
MTFYNLYFIVEKYTMIVPEFLIEYLYPDSFLIISKLGTADEIYEKQFMQPEDIFNYDSYLDGKSLSGAVEIV